jgi:hypothetical protein
MPTSKCKLATCREPLAQENETPMTRHPRARDRDMLAPDVPYADLGHVRFGSKADMCGVKWHVCFTPESGHWAGPSNAIAGIGDAGF